MSTVKTAKDYWTEGPPHEATRTSRRADWHGRQGGMAARGKVTVREAGRVVTVQEAGVMVMVWVPGGVMTPPGAPV